MKKYLIPDFNYEGIVYRSIEARDLHKQYLPWLLSLSKVERRVFRRYRKKNNLKTNINAKLRRDEVVPDAKVISMALSRARSPDNIVVYRNLAKQEYMKIQSMRIGEIIQMKDFKGTHVKTKIKSVWPISNSAGYMLILVSKDACVGYINNLTKFYRKERELLIDMKQSFKLIETTEVLGKMGFVVKLV